MRSNVIVNFIKGEWYSQRRLLFWYFLISVILALSIIFISRNAWVLNQIKHHSGLDFGEFSLTALIIIFMPYAISWMKLCNKTDKEHRTGFYSLVHTMPITVKEMVTAKYISAFLMNGLMVGWLCALWWIYELNFPEANSLTAWTALCMVAFLSAFSVLAIQLGFFFRWGNSSLFTIFLLLLIVVNQFEFTERMADETIKWMDQAPLFLWGMAAVLTVFIWIICWSWSVRTYRKYA